MKKNTFDMTKVRVRGSGDMDIKETIRAHENPAYRKAAEEYERQAKERRMPRSNRAEPRSFSDAEKLYGSGYESSYDYNYDYDREYGAVYDDQEPYGDYDDYDGSGGGSGGGRSRSGRRRKKRRLNKLKLVRNILILLVILFLVFVGFFFHMTSNLDKVETSKDDFAIDPAVSDDLSGYRNIAILGLDARADESYDGSRTDAIIILSIRKSTGKIHMISIMRDSYLKMADSSGNLILDKITHAHHYGGGVDTCAALNRSLDLNISEFMIFNWKAVSDLVDALGGIDVDVKKNEIRDLNKWGPETAENCGGTWNSITTTGVQTIDGIQATTYCRIRKTSGGDTGRGNRYKKVVSAVMKKALTHPGKMAKVSSDVFPKIRTNISKAGMLSAVLSAPRYKFDKSISWPKNYYGGLLSNGVWYAVPRTLSSNVSWLHKKAFSEKGYTPSSTCREISDEIIYYTGIQ